MIALAAPLVGCVLLIAAFAACVGAVASKSLFALVMRLAAGASLVATALVAFGAGDAALMVALVFAIVCPLVLLAVILLSARSVKTSAGRLNWLLSTVAAGLVAAVVFSALPEAAAPAHSEALPAPALPLSLMVFVACAACAGLLGYGERGVFNRRAERGGDEQH